MKSKPLKRRPRFPERFGSIEDARARCKAFCHPPPTKPLCGHHFGSPGSFPAVSVPVSQHSRSDVRTHLQIFAYPLRALAAFPLRRSLGDRNGIFAPPRSLSAATGRGAIRLDSRVRGRGGAGSDDPGADPTSRPSTGAGARAPAVPAELRISASGADFIEWAWNPVPDVSGYDVQYSTNEAFTRRGRGHRPDGGTVLLPKDGSHGPRRAVYLRVRSAAGTGDDRITSDWSTHVTGMTMAAGAGGSGNADERPGNGDGRTPRSRGVGTRWRAQPGTRCSTVTARRSRTTLRRTFASTTTHTVSNLASRTDRYLRVRAYSGTISEPVFGGWSATVEGTTDRPPAPVTTALSAPTGLSVVSRTNNSITVRWNSVDDVRGVRSPSAVRRLLGACILWRG